MVSIVPTPFEVLSLALADVDEFVDVGDVVHDVDLVSGCCGEDRNFKIERCRPLLQLVFIEVHRQVDFISAHVPVRNEDLDPSIAELFPVYCHTPCDSALGKVFEVWMTHTSMVMILGTRKKPHPSARWRDFKFWAHKRGGYNNGFPAPCASPYEGD